MFEVPPREFLAFHEAGHAVMAFLLGRPVLRASIRRQRGLSGFVEFERASSGVISFGQQHRPLLESDALVLLAGRASECERTLGSPLSHGSSDRENARALLRLLEPCDEVISSWLRYLLVRAQWMLQAEWPLVYAIARALLRHEELDGAGVGRVIAEARELRAKREPSNCRLVISERALEDMHLLPQSECSSDLSLDERAAASGGFAEDDEFYRRAIGEVMHLSARARNCLARGGISTLGDLTRRSVRDLQAIRALGAKTLDEILTELRRLDVELPVAKFKGFNQW